jgi:hypothetical protein
MILINKKLLVTLGLSSVVVLSAMTAIQPGPPQPEMKAQNLKVLPKNLTNKQLDHIMDDWSHSLGVRCSFCHARNEETKKMDFASDAKPEKEMAREMFKMTATINKKYFKAGKDSTGMIMYTGVNCYTCHQGKEHPEVVDAPSPKRMGPPPGSMPAPGTPPQGTPPAGTPPNNGR